MTGIADLDVLPELGLIRIFERLFRGARLRRVIHLDWLSRAGSVNQSARREAKMISANVDEKGDGLQSAMHMVWPV